MQRRQMLLTKVGGPDVFRVEEGTLPPREDQMVRVEVKASGINWADIQQRLGLYPEAPPKPYAPGYEVAGPVLEADETSGFRLGERVVSCSRFGGYASHLDVDARLVAKIPAEISNEEAAAVPVVWLTANEALHSRARVRSGESVLVHGGAGGVGLAAIALAKQAGCTVITTAGGARKKEFLEANTDVDAAIDYTARDWRAQLAKIHGNVDHVLDPLGGEHLRQSMEVLTSGGRVIAYGASETAAKGKRSLVQAARTIAKMRFSVVPWLRFNKGMLGLNMLTAMAEEPERMRQDLQNILQQMAQGKLPRPVIAKQFPLEQVAEAHRYLQSRQAIGKVLLIP